MSIQNSIKPTPQWTMSVDIIHFGVGYRCKR